MGKFLKMSTFAAIVNEENYHDKTNNKKPANVLQALAGFLLIDEYVLSRSSFSLTHV
ncbi:hypothetical protein MF628_07910 [Paenibacillus polymyxa]|uniref:hypothetical protein n=1 Tax=Paenibacillus polymyxa TaxID=1406 RepID=UPI0020259FB4|nr:hypothetical protein [Paenibacillus polymyxa]WDZ63794.1 hypothetical protein MF628_07910 [Paenibacillus polymyxa]